MEQAFKLESWPRSPGSDLADQNSRSEATESI